MKYFKKISVLLIMLVMLFAVSCSNGSDDNTNGNSDIINPGDEILQEFSNVSFVNEVFTYDEQPHRIEVSGAIPKDTHITYTNNDQVNVGIYEVSALLECDGYKPLTLVAKMTINKARYDTNSISFLPVIATYDGTEKKVEIVGTLPEGVTVTYENNTLTNVGEIIATAHFSSSNPNYEQIEPMTTKLIITKANLSLSGIKFSDKTVTYDGNEHELLIDGELPKGVNVTYLQNKLTNVGEVEAKAIFKVDLDNYNPLVKNTLSAKLIVKKAVYDLSNISFLPVVSTYDGHIKFVEISGTLPEGVSVTYKNNSLTNAGEVIATAYFSSSNPNYEDIAPMTTKLTINKARLNLCDIIFNDKIVIYDGSEQELLVTSELPIGVFVKYVNNKITNAGHITASAVISVDLDNYYPLNDNVINATLTVNKARYDTTNILFLPKTFTYDGSEKKVEITGALPDGVSVKYENNTLTNAGEVTATAYFTNTNPNYENIESMNTKLTIKKANLSLEGISFEDKTFIYDGIQHEITINGDLSNLFTVRYENNKLTTVGQVKAKAIFTVVSNNHNQLENNTLTALLTVKKAKYDLSNIFFLPLTFVYDGTEKKVEVTGELPKDVTIRYENNTLINAGEVIATVYFNSINPNYEDIAPMTTKLTIKKANLTLNGILFNNKTVTYDGNEHELVIDGNIHSALRVRYENNKLVNAGRVTAKAIFTVISNNYNDLSNNTLEATLTVLKAKYNTANIKFPSKNYIYDGKEKKVEIIGKLPKGVTVKYENNTLINAGEVIATAFFSNTNPNYENIEPMTTKLTIQKANLSLEGFKFHDKTVTYDGREHQISIEGELSNLFSVRYENNKLTNVGQVTAKAIFTVISTNHNQLVDDTLMATLTVLKADFNISGITFSDAIYEYDGIEKELVIKGELPNWLNVVYFNNKLTESGSIKANAKFVHNNPNYNAINTVLTATLTIKEPITILPGITFNDDILYYDNQKKSLSISGELPSDVTVEYEDNGKVEVGKYIVTAIFVSNNPKYKYLKPLTATLTIKLRGLEYKPEGNHMLIYSYDNKTKVLHLPKLLEGKFYVFAEGLLANTSVLEEIYSIDFPNVNAALLGNSKPIIYLEKEYNNNPSIINNIIIDSYQGILGVTGDFKWSLSRNGYYLIYEYTGKDKEIVVPRINNSYGKVKFATNFMKYSNVDFFVDYKLSDVRYDHNFRVYDLYNNHRGITIEGLKYYYSDNNQIVIYDYIGSNRSLKVPNIIDNYPVGVIAPGTFNKASFLEELYINSEVDIKDNFVNCKDIILFYAGHYINHNITICHDYTNNVKIKDNIKYTITTNNEVIILKYLGNEDELILDDNIDGMPILKVLYNAVNPNTNILAKNVKNPDYVDVNNYVGEKGITEGGLKWARTTNGIQIYGVADLESKEVIVTNEVLVNGVYEPISSISIFAFSKYSNTILNESSKSIPNGKCFVINNYFGMKGVTSTGFKWAAVHNGVIIYDYIGKDMIEVVIPNVIDGYPVIGINPSIFDDYSDLVVFNSTFYKINYNYKIEVIDNYGGKRGVYNDSIYWALLNNNEVSIYNIISDKELVSIPSIIDGYKAIIYRYCGISRSIKKVVFDEGFFPNQLGLRFFDTFLNGNYIDNYGGYYGEYDNLSYAATDNNEITVYYFNTSIHKYNYVNVPSYIDGKKVTSAIFKMCHNCYIYIPSTVENLDIIDSNIIIMCNDIKPKWNNEDYKYITRVNDKGIMLKNDFIYYYDLDNKLYIVDSFSYDKDIVVKNILAGHKVEGLSNYSFNLFIKGTHVKTVYLEEGINCIGQMSFSGQVSYDRIYLPRSITTIGDNSFNKCIHGVYSKGDKIDFKTDCNNIYWNCNELKVTNNGFKYYIYNSKVYITDYIGTKNVVNIPLKVEGLYTNVELFNPSTDISNKTYFVLPYTDRINDYRSKFIDVFHNNIPYDDRLLLGLNLYSIYNYGGEYGTTNNGLDWILTNDKTITIVGFFSDKVIKELVLPDFINNYPVTAYKSNAFQTLDDIVIERLVLCNGIIEIDEVINSHNIKSVYIPNSVIKIRKSAFEYLTIYTNHSVKPSGWVDGWCNSQNINWGSKL